MLVCDCHQLHVQQYYLQLIIFDYSLWSYRVLFRFKEEKSTLEKEFKSEIEQLKRELVKANSANINLKEEIEHTTDFPIDPSVKKLKKKQQKSRKKGSIGGISCVCVTRR